MVIAWIFASLFTVARLPFLSIQHSIHPTQPLSVLPLQGRFICQTIEASKFFLHDSEINLEASPIFKWLWICDGGNNPLEDDDQVSVSLSTFLLREKKEGSEKNFPFRIRFIFVFVYLILFYLNILSFSLQYELLS